MRIQRYCSDRAPEHQAHDPNNLKQNQPSNFYLLQAKCNILLFHASSTNPIPAEPCNYFHAHPQKRQLNAAILTAFFKIEAKKR